MDKHYRFSPRRAALLACLLAAAVSARAQTPGREATHPRLWVSAGDLPKLRALAGTAPIRGPGTAARQALKAVRQQADGFLKEKQFSYTVSMPGLEGGPAKEWSYTLSDEAPPRHDDYGHYPCWTGLSRLIETRIVTLSFTAMATGDPRYFDKAKAMVAHLCRWPISWTDPSYSNTGACLDTGHLASAVAMFYDWCYGSLTDAERSLIRQALAEKAVSGLRQAIPSYGVVYWPNGFAVLTAALGLSAVALEGETPEAGLWLRDALRYSGDFFDSQGKDGGCMEGPGYGTYGADTLARFLLALDSSRLDNPLVKHRFFKTLVAYSISQMSPADHLHTGFGDSWFSQPFQLCAALLALRGDQEAAWYLQDTGYTRPATIEQIVTIGLHPERFAAPRRPAWNPSRAFIDVGYASLRDGFNKNAAFMAFKSGPPERVVGHNHYDHNSFQIQFKGTWIATDPGYTGYFDPPDNKYGRCTFGHNTITLDVDEAYLKRMNFPLHGHDQVLLNGGRIADFRSAPGFDYVKGTAADTYSLPMTGARSALYFWREGQANGFSRADGPSPASPDWKRYEISAVAPEEAMDFCLALEYGAADGSVWYDDAEILVDGKPLELPNGGFEEELAHWSPRVAPGETGKQEADASAAHTGRQSARIDGPGGYFYYLPREKRIPIRPGQKIIARFWAKSTTASRMLDRADREVLFIKPYAFVIRDTLAAPAPHAYSFMLHALGSAEVTGKNRAVLSSPGAARLEASIYSPAGVRLKSGFFKGAEQRGPYLQAETGKARSAVITSVLIARDAPFRPTNPGFEDGLAGWVIRTSDDNAKDHVADIKEARSGRRSGRIDSPGGYYYTPRFKVAPGTRLTVRFWARSEGKPDRWSTIYWWLKGHLNENATQQAKGPVISGNRWKRYEYTATVPKDTEEACVALNYFGPGRIWYDDVEVSLAPKTPSMPPGRVVAVQEGERGVVIDLDGLQHLVVFPAGPKGGPVRIGGHRVTCRSRLGCVTLDRKGRPIRAWSLDGSPVSLDGKVVRAALPPKSGLARKP
ncbi:MAG: heparinase II/III family protein [Armatimonadetes bacterium]|nr:heparinase II/III family protein [Armatimonadota bacterium]